MKATKKQKTKGKQGNDLRSYGSEEDKLEEDISDGAEAMNKQKLTNHLWTRIISVNMYHPS